MLQTIQKAVANFVKDSQTEFREGVMRAAKAISKRLGFYGSPHKVAWR